MKLHEFNPVVVFLSHHRISQPLGSKGLAYTRCALQNDIHLVAEHAHQSVVHFVSHIDFRQEVLLRIRWNLLLMRVPRIFIANDVHDELIFFLGQFEKTAVRIFEELHFRQLRTFL